MKTLLAKTRNLFVACTVAVFALTAPLFYLITKHFYAEDIVDIIESVKQGHGLPALDLEADIVAGMMVQFVLVFAAVSMSFYITARLAARRLWRPFNDTLRKTGQFNVSHGKLPEFAPTDIVEFENLNQSLAKLMQKDIETFRIQKEFSENASHELQTPLAVMRGKLDLLMQEQLDERSARLVADMYSLVTRMSHLNRNLLLLAKIDNAQYADTVDADPYDMAHDALPLYRTLLHGSTISLADRRTRKTTVKANTALLECLLKNLVVNAIRHTPQGGNITITVTDNTLSVSNPSADGTPLNATTLFRRFGNTTPQEGGNGLGLAIVKAVCDYHGWQIDYSFGNGRHLFTVDFNMHLT